MLPQHAIVESTPRLLKGQRHEKRERGDHKKQSEEWDGEYKHMYPCEEQWDGEDHLEGHEERRLGMSRSHWRRGTTNLYLEQSK